MAIDTKKEEISLTQHVTFVSLQPKEISRQILLSLFAETDLKLEDSLVTCQLIPIGFFFFLKLGQMYILRKETEVLIFDLNILKTVNISCFM